jgi:glutamate/tyrosine decarboxylase-like PLP-dependent enzyme
MFELADAHEELEAVTLGLSIATFRYVGKADSGASADRLEELNALNKAIMERLQSEGRVFLTNAVIDGKFVLRACIVNFRTGEDDVRATIDEVVQAGRALAASGAAVHSGR